MHKHRRGSRIALRGHQEKIFATYFAARSCVGCYGSLALEAPVDAIYGVIRAGLEQLGQPIGANDLLVAAHAMALDLTLVTDNEREFLQIDDLRVENWLR